MRSALTMLGIIIGVAAVIAMFAVGTGANRQIAETISGMGSNLLMILPGATTSGGARMRLSSDSALTLEDAWATFLSSVVQGARSRPMAASRLAEAW